MALRRTVDLLPEIFRTNTNKKFLSATLDQLIQEPNLKRTQGYVGRRVGPGVNPADRYVVEPTPTRTDYQLEPGVVFLDNNTQKAKDAITYPGMIDSLALQGGYTNRQDRLFESQYYTWDPFVDFDKFNNYSQYYWLAAGPDSVYVGTNDIPLEDNITVTRNEFSYKFSGYPVINPIITLVRGGNYTFSVDQPGHHFWIQSTPGVNGRLPYAPNISSREVFGVQNNGEDDGTVTFYVPLKTSQDFYYSLTDVAPVDLITHDLKFTDLNNVYVDSFLAAHPSGIDGITTLNGKTLVFTRIDTDVDNSSWAVTTQFDPVIRTVPPTSVDPLDGAIGTFDTVTFDQTSYIDVQSQRYSVWRINYQYDSDGRAYMVLESIRTIPNLAKFSILYGEIYNNTQYYKDASGFFKRVPLLTAVQNTLYYQDSTNPEIFGEIRLIDQEETQPIDINEIIGAKNYTSPNGVKFTNGLKVQFRGPTHPAQYQNQEYYVEGVGTGFGIQQRVGFVDGQAYFGPYHTIAGGQKVIGAYESGEFQQFIYSTVEESLLNYGAGYPVGAPLPQNAVIGAANGNGITLIPVNSLITPETYTKSEQLPYDSVLYDEGGYDANLNAPLVPDYFTINRASNNLNAWTRSNRWFHIDVINYSAELNNATPVIDNELRAKRPIIEFRKNLRLWNMGTQAKVPVNIIDFSNTDALSSVKGQIGYGVDGYTFLNGTRVIFANDQDPQVRNKIYQVEFIDPADTGTSTIDLVPVVDGSASYLQNTVCLNGATLQGKTFWYNGDTWILAQEKTSVNQPPMFDVFDKNGFSLGDKAVYPSSTFAGSRLFGYTDGGTSILDEVLGISLKFLNINNVGDILFSNYFYTDTFIYVKDRISITENISKGFVRQYVDRILFSSQLGWQRAAAENRSRQVFRFTFSGAPLVLDVPIDVNAVYPPLQIFINGVFLDPGRYTYSVDSTTTTITINGNLDNGTILEVQALSNVASAVAFYQIPINLENNALNQNGTQFTLGTIRTHYDSIGQNLRNIVGPINGANNSRDLGNIIPYGQNIVQQSAPLILPAVFMREAQYELFNSLAYNSQEYEKYKALLLELSTRGDFVNLTPTQVLDAVVQTISVGRNELFPFYWSDMLPAGETYTSLTYTISPISTTVFEIGKVYNFTSSNFQSLMVYLNGTILVRGYDYTVSSESSTINVTTPLNVGDVIEIREYPTTYGSYVPNTPTKLGLYPAFKPEIYYDETYVDPTNVIRGHDGSITIAFGDFRDQVLLEFETRIFNNLKISTPIPLVQEEVIPGQFRTTEYSLEEINSILYTDFLGWIGYNKIDYTSQNYVANNPFTYNYSQSSNRLNNQPLLGGWRGIYTYFYDTETPNTTPWEMLGFSQEPTWWADKYGPAPYTAGNMVLWEDLERGFIADPMNPRIDPLYARPGLTQVIPSGTEGELLPPLYATVGNYDATSFRRSWTFGDEGPVENTWRTSSSWPFAVMRLLALTKPAKFFSVFVDRDLYVYNNSIEQYLWDGRYRLQSSNLGQLYGNGTSKASYIDWIIDYNQQRGIDSTTNLTQTLSNLDIRLCWRLAAFSDKKYLKISTERSTPGGSNTNLTLPDESYELLLYKNPPSKKITFSSVIVQNTTDGWAVYGYNVLASYFEILASKPLGKTITISAGGSSERVPVEYTNELVRVPYGFVFTNRGAVCDFLLSYGEYLKSSGMVFDTIENGHIMDWDQMAQEFLYWSNQGWASGSIINLNPGATTISVTQPGLVAESTFPPRPDSIILNQNRQAIQPADLVIDRLDNTFKISSLSANTINFLNLRFTAYEHMVVLDNRSIFADLIYDPTTGGRQSRILVSGWLSGDWNGQVNAPGFVLNQDNVQEWSPKRKYTKGDIVLFKDQYWSASTIIKPSAEFDYNLWLKSDYAQIQQGLLPNAANDSDQLEQAYSVYDANLEQDVDLFSYGLIGFRPRQYMEALNLDDISQVNLYQQFIGTKGTRRSTNLFSLARLGKEIAEYNIYEYWALLRSTYGANANDSYFEILLNEAQLHSDPSVVQVIQPGESSEADQTVYVNDIWKSSYKISNTQILPTTTTPGTDTGLPSAGYVNLDDVDITVFDLTDPENITNVLNSVGVGTIVWVAKVNTYDWDIYRAEKVPGAIVSIQDNLNSQGLVTFTQPHNLVPSDMLIIKNFDASVDGVYRVLTVPGTNQLTVSYTFTGFETTKTGNGLGLTLLSTRVAQPSDIPSLPYADQLQAGVRVWVDDNGNGLWTVLEKSDPFVDEVDLSAATPIQNSQFGASISQGMNNLSAMIGAPGYNPLALAAAPGAVYTYIRNDSDQYQQNTLMELTATGSAGYGNAIDIGNQTWGVVGASESNNGQGYATTIYIEPASNIFEQRQLLLAPDQDFSGGKFGYSATMSLDERWMYIAAPEHNRVYAYTRVDVQNQTVRYRTSATNKIYNWNNHLQINYTLPNQLYVILNNQLLQESIDYSVTDSNIVLTSNPENNQLLEITRRQEIQLDQKTNYDVEQSAIYGTGSGAKFTIDNVRGNYGAEVTSPGTGYVVGSLLTISQDDIATPDATPPSPVSKTYVSYVGTTITVSGTTGIVPGMTVTGTGFFSGQYVVSVPGPGSVIVNAAPDSTPTGTLTFSHDAKIRVAGVNGTGGITSFVLTGTGVTDTTVFPLDQYLATATDIYSFTVIVNNTLYRPHIDYDFNSDSALLAYDLVFNTVPPQGAVIDVFSQTHFSYVTALTVPSLAITDNFGYSISCNTNGSHVMVGTPNKDSGQGQVYVFDRSVEKFIVTNSSQTQYRPVQDLTTPGFVSVTLNGEFLVNTELNVGGTFTVDTTNLADQFVEILTTLAVGDVIEISTNQFTLLETLASAAPSQDALYGYRVDQCINNCSLYISSPYDSSLLPEAGKVEFLRNQTRVYGTITSLIANPTLVAGEYIRVNNVFVECTGTTVAELVENINSAGVPNAVASSTPDVAFVGDGSTTIFNVGNIYADAESYTTKVYVAGVLKTAGVDYTYDPTAQTITFVFAPFKTASILVVSGRITISVINSQSAQALNKLQVAPGTGSIFEDLGFNVYTWQQNIVSPVPQYQAHFGQGLFISDDTTTLLVGAPNGSMIEPTTFDNGTTYFDSRSTVFSDIIKQSGAVYSYDFLPSAHPTVQNPGQFVFGQQFVSNNTLTLDQFGTALDYTTGVLLVGAPGSDLNSGNPLSNYGQVMQYHNLTNSPSWYPIRVQQPAVDTALLNTIFIYDLPSGGAKRNYLDFFNPLQGRILGVCRQNINYIGAVDPAAYNLGAKNNYGSRWGENHVGEIWWDTTNTRFIDPNQNSTVYASRRWGQLFPGSQVQMYQWVASAVPPAQYSGPGTPKSIDNYSVSSSLSLEGFLQTEYYFWVTGISEVNRAAKKTLSINTLTRYIENPKASGISYLAPIGTSTLGLYNCGQFISARDSILYVGFDKIENQDAVHVEYQLVGQDKADDFLSNTLYKKFLDSLTGSDSTGRPVPDPFLSPSERYGVQFRPRQSMVINRFLALKSYIGKTNETLALYPISESRRLVLLNSSEPEPSSTSGQWDKRVANFEELTYQNLAEVPLGYRYLVQSDATNSGFWTIYQVQSGDIFGSRRLGLLRVQDYDTRRYWDYVNWYRANYNPLTRILTEVPNVASLDTLNVPNGSAVKVTSNAQNKWEIYLLENGAWNRVALEGGTIQISNVIWDYAAGRFGFDSEVFDAQYFDQGPTVETRKILQAINEELFVDDLLIERNRLLVLMFNYILSEQIAPQWLTKTSLIDVDHIIRNLEPYQIYRRDNQDFVFDYIQEVKPYHVQIREFNLKYQGFDQYNGTVDDFDVPAYYDTNIGMFISPILDNVGDQSTTSSRASSDPIWQTFPWNQWYQNYLLDIESVTVIEGGSGYTTPPAVTVTGDCTRQAVMSAQINSAGQVVAINVLDPGDGYSTTATVTLSGGNGSGARAVAVMGNNKVRNLCTVIKYDRLQYHADLTDWLPDVAYVQGERVRYEDRVWEANSNLNTAEFDPTQWTLIPAGDLPGVDRTMGYYVPTPDQPGLDLALLISGTSYPGVQVTGLGFESNTGFDVGNYDINPYDNISYGPDGTPSYDPALLDTIYESEFTDPYLGILPAPAYNGDPPTVGSGQIIVSGGEFVDTYESHAPEELVPGITYDTLDMRVFTTAGSDWDNNGHGFPTVVRGFVLDSQSLNFADAMLNPVSVEVWNQSTGVELSPGIDYEVDWINYEITVLQNAASGEIIRVLVCGLGGGNQVYSKSYIGDEIDNVVVIPYPYDSIESFAIFVNGEVVTSYTFESIGVGYTGLEFSTPWTSSDRVTITAMGTTTPGISSGWSTPRTQVFESDGSLSYTLTYSLSGTNPANLVVNKNGVRARPAEGIEYVGNGATTTYNLPTRGGYSLSLVADNEVAVYVDNVPQVLNVNYLVNPVVGTDKSITFATAPAAGSNILISVRTKAQYWVVGNTLIFQPSQGLTPVLGDIISVTSWNDTARQNILTQVFVGPNQSGIVVTEAYDSTLYDEGTVTGGLGSFDYQQGILITNNRFDTGRDIIDPSRLTVTKDGQYLFPDQGWYADGSVVVISGPSIGPATVIAITSLAQSVVPGEIAFGIFQDMRGLQSSYKIIPSTTTKLTQNVSATDDVIYVEDASHLSEPDLPNGYFGIASVNGERIAYRVRNLVNNSISGLRRGISGTGADAHLANAAIYDVGLGSNLPVEYQNYWNEQNFDSNGVTSVFVTDSINVSQVPLAQQDDVVRVSLGGVVLTSGYTVTGTNPVAVTFDQTPPDGYQVNIAVEQGQSWYTPGIGTASNGQALQETDTLAARFIRGG